MNEMRSCSVEKAFYTICKLENRLNELEKGVAILSEHEYKIDAFKELINDRFSYMQIALDKSEQTVNNRLVTINEYREQLKDQANTFVTSVVLEARLKIIDTKTDIIQRIVYIGIGVFIVLQIAMQVLMRFIP